MSTQRVAAAVLDALREAVGDAGWSDDPAELEPWLVDQRGRYRGRAPLLLRPQRTEEVAAVVRLCARAGVGIVPQGGNTGLVGGSVPDEGGGQVLLSLSRMSRVRAVDAEGFTMTVEAGCVLADVQAAAREAGRLFPLSLAAEGSCRIGGNLATNAGGTSVLRYGNARDLVLGLEVVLADGRVWEGLRRLRKDNTGYDLKQLFLGSEGTLGIITAAVLRLFPRPRQVCTALIAVASPAAATALLARCREASGDAVSSFEYIDRDCLDLVLEYVPGTRDPMAQRYAHYVLAELGTPRAGDDLAATLEGALAQCYGEEEVLDAVIASSEGQAEELWRLRETIPEAERHHGSGIKHDVSVPVSCVAEFLGRAREALASRFPRARTLAFGHLGDGNIHFNVVPAEAAAGAELAAQAGEVTRVVHDLAMDMDGSFSAEHGIGRFKRDELLRYKSPVEIALMRSLKQALDPAGILNPGKVL